MTLKGKFTIIGCIFAAVLISQSEIVSAKPHRMAAKYKKLFGKTWVLDKVFDGKNDMTTLFVKQQLGGKKFFHIFNTDGSVKTDKVNVTSASWYFKDKYFRIKEDMEIDGNKQSQTPYYTITKLTDKELFLDITAMKISFRFKAK